MEAMPTTVVVVFDLLVEQWRGLWLTLLLLLLAVVVLASAGAADDRRSNPKPRPMPSHADQEEEESMTAASSWYRNEKMHLRGRVGWDEGGGCALNHTTFRFASPS